MRTDTKIASEKRFMEISKLFFRQYFPTGTSKWVRSWNVSPLINPESAVAIGISFEELKEWFKEWAARDETDGGAVY